jgi:glycerophosphoryl diester phosphodiesterase
MLPENSIPSFLAGMADGADGIELDVEITQDGQLIVMHDDDVNRTTNCTGCVSELMFDEIRACLLLDGAGVPTEEHPPTLAEVYDEIPSPALINVELKVYGPDCLSDTTGPDALVPLALEEVARLGGERRTLFSSFDTEAAELVKLEQPEYYSALLLVVSDSEAVQRALLLGQDAIHPRTGLVDAETVQEALDSGLQVNVWTVNSEAEMEANIEKGATGIITDVPRVLADLLAN